MIKVIFRIAAGLVLLISLLLAGGFTYEQIVLARVRERYPAPGKLVDVGGRRLHILCKGGGDGPTVVMEVGPGDASYRFWAVQDRIAEFAHVCVYDRANFGWSDDAPEGRSMEQRAGELHTLLVKANMSPPFVLAAHSMGGFLIRLFARDHRGEVAGLVFIDSSEEGLYYGPQFSNYAPQFYEQQLDRFLDLLQQAEWSARFGLLPVFNKFHQDIGPTRQLPENARAMDVRPVTFRAGRDDLISIARLVPPSQRKAGGFGGSLGEIPMIVISHGLVSPGAPKGMQAAFLESSERLTALSSNSLHIVAKNSRHYIYMSEPELVVDAIRRVHAAARGGTRLNGPVPRASK